MLNEVILMLKSVEGIYRDGKIELVEMPEGINEARVIVDLVTGTEVGGPYPDDSWPSTARELHKSSSRKRSTFNVQRSTFDGRERPLI